MGELFLYGTAPQMGGRAGRRGLDDRGLVVLMMDERMDPAVAKDMLHGRSDPLNSAFHVTYGSMINMMRMEGAENVENLISKSFAQFQVCHRARLLHPRLGFNARSRPLSTDR